jgi:hypothetical protein
MLILLLKITTESNTMQKSLYLRQLKDRNPDKRKAAIKAAARAIDGDALKQLAVMCEDDPDSEVRDLALRVGAFIRKQVRGEGSTNVKAVVSEDNARRAQVLINEAMTAQSSHQKSRAMKNLSQALQLDPNLRSDGYFINVAEIVTEHVGDGAAAIVLLDNQDERKTLTRKALQAQQQKQAESHLEEVSKVKWNAALFDFMMLFVVMLVGTLLVLFMAVQSAQGYIDKIDENVRAVNAARDQGRIRIENGKEIFLSTEVDEVGKPKTFEVITIDRDFWRAANTLRKTEFTALLPVAFGVAAGSAVLMLVFASVTHFSAAVILRGQGKLTYLAQNMLSMMTTRMMTLLILLGVSMIAIFEFGSGTVIMIVAGIASLMVCMFALSLITLTSKAYHFGFAKALIAVLPASFVVGVVAFVASLVL